MPFNDEILAGDTLIRNAIQSENYVAATSGWRASRDGDAEFNDLTIRGKFSTTPGGGDNSQIVIQGAGPAPAPQTASIQLFSGDPQEIYPASISNRQDSGTSWLDIETSDDGGGTNILSMLPPVAADGAGWTFKSVVPFGQPVAKVALNGDVQLYFPNNGSPVSLASTKHPVAIGNDAGINLAMDSNAIQVRSNGAASPLTINKDGGNVTVGKAGAGTLIARNDAQVALATTPNGFMIGAAAGTNLVASNNVIQARNNGAVSTLYLNNLGGATNVGANLTVDDNVQVAGGALLNSNHLYHAASAALYVNWGVGDVNLGGVVTTSGLLNMNGGFRATGPTCEAWNPDSGTGGAACTWVDMTGGRYRLRRVTSSLRYKENVADLKGPSVKKILALRARTFNRNDDRDLETDEFLPVTKDSPRYTGFIAEEAHDLGLSDWVTYEADGEKRPDGFSYAEFVVAHQVVLQHQQARIEALETAMGLRSKPSERLDPRP